MIRSFAVTASLALVLGAASSASAFWPYAPYAAYNYGWGWNHATDYVPAPPYFAVHPPVYYAPYITARHYGASPHAWLPGMQPITYVPRILTAPRVTAVSKESRVAAHVPAEPKMIENPHVLAANASGGVNEPVAQPLRIENPHFARR